MLSLQIDSMDIGQFYIYNKLLSSELDDTWLPPTEIRIAEPSVLYDPVGSAEFRIEELVLPKLLRIYKNITAGCRIMCGWE